MSPQISVIIPCYNYARYLEDAVQSVLAQTYSNFEIFVVNDGSTDGTKEIAEGLTAKHSNRQLQLINQEHMWHPSLSRNRGIAASHGRFILCLDADDMIAPTMLEECLAVLERDPSIAIAYTDRLDFGDVDQVVHAGDYDFARLKYENHISYCALYRREVWEKIGGYRANMRLSEPWDFWVAAGMRGYFGYRIPQPLFKYRRHERGRFQDAQFSLQDVHARIVLNNSEVYSSEEVERAMRSLDADLEQASQTRPLVSVIVPTYNRPEMLEIALRSILRQTYRNFEIIVVNDAGVDVKHVIESLNSKKSITYITHELNKEPSAARNTGIRAARGKYLAYLDDDDSFYPDHLETLVTFLERSCSAVAYTDAYRALQVKENNRLITKHRDLRYSFDFDDDRMLINNFIPITCVMHEKKCIDAVGPFDESLRTNEDWDLWIRMSRQFKFFHLKKVTCEYTWRIDGRSLQSIAWNDFYGVLEHIFDKYKEYAAGKPRVLSTQKKHLDGERSAHSQMYRFEGMIISYERGFYEDERGWRWMSDEAVIGLKLNEPTVWFLMFEIGCAHAVYYPSLPFDVYIFHEEELIEHIQFHTDKQLQQVCIPLRSTTDRQYLRLVSEQSYVPYLLGINNDVRRLSVRVGNPFVFRHDALSSVQHNSIIERLHHSTDRTSLKPTNEEKQVLLNICRSLIDRNVFPLYHELTQRREHEQEFESKLQNVEREKDELERELDRELARQREIKQEFQGKLQDITRERDLLNARIDENGKLYQATVKSFEAKAGDKEILYRQKVDEYIYVRSTLSYSVGRIITAPFAFVYDLFVKTLAVIDGKVSKALWPRGTKRSVIINALMNLRQTVAVSTYLLRVHGIKAFIRATRNALRAGDNAAESITKLASPAPIEVKNFELYDPSQELEPTNIGVSVVIPTLNAADDLIKLLPTLNNQKGFREIEVIVVDSGSTDDTVALAEEYGAKVVRIRPEDFSHSGARNIGAENARQPYLLFMVQDALPTSYLWLYRMFTFLKKEKIVAVSCMEIPRIDADLFPRVENWHHFRTIVELNGKDKLLSKPVSNDPAILRKNAQLSDVACLIERKVFMKYKFRYNYAEDLDLGLRIITDGYKIGLMSSTKVIHSHNRLPYYYMKRGFTDKLVIAQILNEPTDKRAELSSLMKDIFFTYQALETMRLSERQNDKSPVPVEDLINEFKEKLRTSMRGKYPARIEVKENEYLDKQCISFLETLQTQYCREGVNGSYDGFLLKTMSGWLDITFDYMRMTNDLVDEQLLKDFWSLVYKLYANLIGRNLAACLMNTPDSQRKQLESITTVLHDRTV